jgi:hypothetical protein
MQFSPFNVPQNSSACSKCPSTPQKGTTMRISTFILSAVLVSAIPCFAQHSEPSACVIVKRHVHVLGENMTRLHPHRPFDYVEGTYPDSFKWRSEMSDGDVRDLQQKGGRVVVLRPDYQLADLEDARKSCREPQQSAPK